MNPLSKARDRAGRSLRTARDGTTRTAGWVKDGVTGGFGSAKSGVTGLVRRGPRNGDAAKPAAAGKTADATPADGPLSGLVRRARENRTTAIAWAAVALLALAWIAWTVYVWIENGSTAGVGVLVSWPAVIAALALIAAPFVGATLLFRRMGIGGPQIAGAAGIAEGSKGSAGEAPAKPDKKDESESEDEDEPESDEEDEGESEEEDESEEEPADADAKDEAAG